MILVTGGTGLLGTHLILQLHSKGIVPKAIYRSQIPNIVLDKAVWIQADLLDVLDLEAAMQQVTQVYHVAGLVSFNPKDKKLLHKINIEGTANVVNACIHAGVTKLVHVSSVAALGRIRPGQEINESMVWTDKTSNSEYGKTKYLGEMEVWRGVGEGLNAVVINPTIILGEHTNWSKGSMQLFESVYHGFPYYSTGKTGFVDADDVAIAMIGLMDSSVTGQKFIVSAENITYGELLFEIADKLGVKRPHKKVTPLLASIAWRIEKLKSIVTGKSPLITKETSKTAQAIVTYNNNKLLQALPNFTYDSLKATIARIALAKPTNL